MIRVAIYFTPSPESLLGRTAAQWLGRDVFSSLCQQQPPSQLSSDTFRAITAAPFHYGFHGTIKPPFMIEEERDIIQITERLEEICDATEKFYLPELQLRFMSNFLCLMPSIPCRQLQLCAAQVVTDIDQFRLPLSEEELTKRRRTALTPAQSQMLEKWGYPYVMDEFRFHLTLTGKIEDPQIRKVVGSHAQTFFTPEMCKNVAFEGLSLFVEEDGAPLVRKSFHSFTQKS